MDVSLYPVFCSARCVLIRYRTITSKVADKSVFSGVSVDNED